MAGRPSRAADALARAALDLATEKPIDKITVTELARHAGVTRETIYQYVPSVVDAVAQALAAEYDDPEAAASGIPPVSPTGDSVFREPTRRVVAHIAARAQIYRHAMNPHLHARLRELLVDNLAQGLLLHVRAHPEIAPAVARGRPDAFALRAFAAYGGAGTVGVIEEWLRSDDPVDIDTLTDVILAAAPEWWQGRG